MTNPLMMRSRTGNAAGQIGELTILAMIDDMNERRAERGIPIRYHPIFAKDGALTFTTHTLPHTMAADTPSRRYVEMDANDAVRAGYPRLPKWKPSQEELLALKANIDAAGRRRAA